MWGSGPNFMALLTISKELALTEAGMSLRLRQENFCLQVSVCSPPFKALILYTAVPEIWHSLCKRMTSAPIATREQQFCDITINLYAHLSQSNNTKAWLILPANAIRMLTSRIHNE